MAASRAARDPLHSAYDCQPKAALRPMFWSTPSRSQALAEWKSQHGGQEPRKSPAR